MNEKLQQAISAARNGQATEAQLLLTQVLKENPDETQAWFLLSTLVDSEQKKVAYLGKVLALEPDHQMAQKMLARLQEPAEVETAGEEIEIEAEIGSEVEEVPVSAPVAASHDTSDFLAQEKGDTLPDWLITEEGFETVEGLEPAPVNDDEVAADTDSELPDWLQEGVAEDWSEAPPSGEAPVEAAPLPDKKVSVEPTPKPELAAKEDHAGQRRFLTGILYALVAVTAVIFIITIYLAWNIFF